MQQMFHSGRAISAFAIDRHRRHIEIIPAITSYVRQKDILTLPSNDGFWAESGLTIAMHGGHFNDRNAPRTGPWR
jgi:hypothetical protein